MRSNNVFVDRRTQTTPAASGQTRRVRLALEHITIDARLQSRELKQGVVNDYAAVLRRGGVFPPVLVVHDGHDKYYLVDGHHRVAATQQLNGIDGIDTEILEGTFTDALWLSWGANRDHGLRRTQEDKRRAIRAALQHPKWSKKSNRAIGSHIGCDHKTVAAIRRSLAAGEFPRECPATSPKIHTGPSKRAILKACRVLATVQQEQTYQFDLDELNLVKAGFEAMQCLLFGHKPQEKYSAEANACFGSR